MSSIRRKQANQMADLLRKYEFVGTFLVAREKKESYQDIVEHLKPDILIEDDCKSIGGAWQMCISKLKPEIRKKFHINYCP